MRQKLPNERMHYSGPVREGRELAKALGMRKDAIEAQMDTYRTRGMLADSLDQERAVTGLKIRRMKLKAEQVGVKIMSLAVFSGAGALAVVLGAHPAVFVAMVIAAWPTGYLADLAKDHYRSRKADAERRTALELLSEDGLDVDLRKELFSILEEATLEELKALIRSERPSGALKVEMAILLDLYASGREAKEMPGWGPDAGSAGSADDMRIQRETNEMKSSGIARMEEARGMIISMGRDALPAQKKM